MMKFKAYFTEKIKREKVRVSPFFSTLLALLTVVIWIASGASVSYAKENSQTTDIMVSSGFKDSNVKYIQSIEDGQLTLENKTEFRVKAKIEPVVGDRETIFSEKKLHISRDEVVCVDYPCQKKWEFDFSKDEEFDFIDFPKFQLAWKESFVGNTPGITVNAFFQNSDCQETNGCKDILITGSYGPGKENPELTEIKTVNMDYAGLTQKSRGYLAKREHGFSADSHWRYDKDGKNLVIQSRVDIPLSECQAIKFYLGSDYQPEKIQFSVDTDGDLDRDLFLLWEQLDIKRYKENGQDVIYLDLHRALKNAGADIEKGILLEPIIFIPTDISSFKKNKPIKKIVFGVPSEHSDHVVSPKVENQPNNPNVRALEFDFTQSPLLRDMWDVRLNKIEMTADFNSPQIFSWETARLIDTLSDKVPVALFQSGAALKKWSKNMPPIGKHEVITSFAPLFHMENKKGIGTRPQKTNIRYKNEDFQDSHLEIKVKNAWYQIDGDKQTLKIKGIFTGEKSSIDLKIGKFSKSCYIKIKTKNMDDIVVRRVGKRIFNLPFAFLSGEKGLYLEKDTTILFGVKNEPIVADTATPLIREHAAAPQRHAPQEKYKTWEFDIEASRKGFFEYNKTSETSEYTAQYFYPSEPVVKKRLWASYKGDKPLRGSLEYFDHKKADPSQMEKSEPGPLRVENDYNIRQVEQTVNIRKYRTTQSMIVGKLYAGDVVKIGKLKNRWRAVFPMDQNGENEAEAMGYVYDPLLKPVSDIIGKLGVEVRPNSDFGKTESELTHGSIDSFHKKSMDLFFDKNNPSGFLEMERGGRIIGFKPKKNLDLDSDAEFEYELTLFDVTMEMIHENNLSNIDWWDYEESIKLAPESGGIMVDAEKDRAYLFKARPKQNLWAFTLGDKQFLKPVSFSAKEHIPPGCSGKLFINGEWIDIENNDGVIKLSQYSPIKNFLFIIESFDNSNAYKIKTPVMRVMGVKHTLSDEMDALKINIGDSNILVSLADISRESHSWTSMGSIELPGGEHFISTESSKYFKVDALFLETDHFIPFATEDETEKIESTSLISKLIWLAVKLILLAGLMLIVYWRREKIRKAVRMIWNPFKTGFLKYYRFVPDEGWAVLWLTAGSGLYSLSLMHKAGGENYAATFGGIFIVIGLRHLSLLLKGWVMKKFRTIGESVYRTGSAQFFAWAIILLVFTALFVAFRMEAIAEQIAIIVYYLLVAGVVGEIINLKKEKRNESC